MTLRPALAATWMAALAAAVLSACAPARASAEIGPVATESLAASTAAAPWDRARERCGGKAFGQAARINTRSFRTLEWTPFGRKETGWEIYAPRVAEEIGTDCDPRTPGFARALARWQFDNGLAADGMFGPDTFQVFKGVWQERRPFVMARVGGAECPEPPHPSRLAPVALEEETFERPDRMLRAEVLEAWRAMVAAAREEVPAIRQDPKALTIFSGYRDPDADAERCAREGNCDGARRAVCSPHRTGTAVDLNVGWAEGFTADALDRENRLHQVRGPAYRWLIRNAWRFSFVNYAYEPWHWEYVGPLETGPAVIQEALERPMPPEPVATADAGP